MTDKPVGKRWRWGKVPWIIAALLVLYLLSIGPAAWVTVKIDPGHTGWPTTLANAVYRPLGAAAELTGMQAVLARYILLFANPWR